MMKRDTQRTVDQIVNLFKEYGVCLQPPYRCEGCGKYTRPDPHTPEGQGHIIGNVDGSMGYCGPVTRKRGGINGQTYPIS